MYIMALSSSMPGRMASSSASTPLWSALRAGIGLNHDGVLIFHPPVLIDIHHGAQLFHAGQNGEFFRLDTADARGAQHGAYIGGDFLPVALDLPRSEARRV